MKKYIIQFQCPIKSNKNASKILEAFFLSIFLSFRGTRNLHKKLTQSFFPKLSSYLRRSLVPRDDNDCGFFVRLFFQLKNYKILLFRSFNFCFYFSFCSFINFCSCFTVFCFSYGSNGYAVCSR